MTTRLPPQRPPPQAPAPRRRATGQLKLPTQSKGSTAPTSESVHDASGREDPVFAPPQHNAERSESRDAHDASAEEPGNSAEPQGGKKQLPTSQAKTGRPLAKLGQALPHGHDRSVASAAAQLSATSYSNLAPVGAMQQSRLTGTNAKLERPPDAFKLLKEAKDEGVLFSEDWRREGHTEDQDDPELAAAVEECIRLCFGVPGILRIGPGRDDKQVPIIVVVATHGFGEQSFARIPERVHRFDTTVAIPFELLPLKRPR